MSYNVQKELQKFWEEEEKLIEECEKAGMTGEAIDAILEYDMERFRQDRAFYRRTLFVDFEAVENELTENGGGMVFRKYRDILAIEDRYFEDRYEDLIETVDDPVLYKALKALTPIQRRVLGLYAFDGYSTYAIADILGRTQPNIVQHIRLIRKKMKKFL